MLYLFWLFRVVFFERPCLLKRKKRVFCSFFSARGKVLLPREARFCYRERDGHASRKEKENTGFLMKKKFVKIYQHGIETQQ